MEGTLATSLESFYEIHCKLVGILLCSSMFAVLRPKMMIKLMENHKWVLKFFSATHMNCLGFGNITSNALAILLGQSDLQMRDVYGVKIAKRSDGFISLFHENHLNNVGFEQAFIVEQLHRLFKLLEDLI
jgi:hypothetical protein